MKNMVARRHLRNAPITATSLFTAGIMVADYVKFLKHGYGKASDHASRDIRLKRKSREEGIALVAQYEGIKPSAQG